MLFMANTRNVCLIVSLAIVYGTPKLRHLHVESGSSFHSKIHLATQERWQSGHKLKEEEKSILITMCYPRCGGKSRFAQLVSPSIELVGVQQSTTSGPSSVPKRFGINNFVPGASSTEELKFRASKLRPHLRNVWKYLLRLGSRISSKRIRRKRCIASAPTDASQGDLQNHPIQISSNFSNASVKPNLDAPSHFSKEDSLKNDSKGGPPGRGKAENCSNPQVGSSNDESPETSAVQAFSHGEQNSTYGDEEPAVEPTSIQSHQDESIDNSSSEFMRGVPRRLEHVPTTHTNQSAERFVSAISIKTPVGKIESVLMFYDTGSDGNMVARKLVDDYQFPMRPILPKNLWLYNTAQNHAFIPTHYVEIDVLDKRIDTETYTKISFSVVDSIGHWELLVGNIFMAEHGIQLSTPRDRSSLVMSRKLPSEDDREKQRALLEKAKHAHIRAKEVKASRTSANPSLATTSSASSSSEGEQLSSSSKTSNLSANIGSAQRAFLLLQLSRNCTDFTTVRSDLYMPK
ncbi:hypothetical protein G7Y89_g4277 [Cudoniella acicularis]|uniref:Uncharacterized protein n=1 Tax=Cudoniella acicularis TaxID=354080 RepID=A0A8H4RPT8_9HELO|nr:hypothetical protein G7Y89_g4277 [Cudoniella acicularis]